MAKFLILAKSIKEKAPLSSEIDSDALLSYALLPVFALADITDLPHIRIDGVQDFLVPVSRLVMLAVTLIDFEVSEIDLDGFKSLSITVPRGENQAERFLVISH